MDFKGERLPRKAGFLNRGMPGMRANVNVYECPCCGADHVILGTADGVRRMPCGNEIRLVIHVNESSKLGG